MESNTQLIANRESWRDAAKRRKLEDIEMLLQGAIQALGKVGLMLNVHRDNLAAVLGVLPALKRPTISHLSDDDWMAVNTILDETTVRTIIPRLKQAGGEGIVEYPLNKIVLSFEYWQAKRWSACWRARRRDSPQPKPWCVRFWRPCANAATAR